MRWVRWGVLGLTAAATIWLLSRLWSYAYITNRELEALALTLTILLIASAVLVLHDQTRPEGDRV